MNPFVGYDNIIPLLEPKDIASTVTASSYMHLKTANRAGFLDSFGAVTSDSADVETVTVEAATAADGTEAAIAFNYRKSGALGTNAWGAITAATTAGFSVDPAADDNKLYWIEIDPAVLGDSQYVRVKLTDTTDMAACLVAVTGFIDTIYKQTSFITATASASA